MATHMSPTFTGAGRRKKLVTYGRSARLAAPSRFLDDASSPERPRKVPEKPPTIAPEPEKHLRPVHAFSVSRATRQKSSAPDHVFDVPSDDEPTPRAIRAPTKKPVSRDNPPDVIDVHGSSDERSVPKRTSTKTHNALRKVDPVRPIPSADKGTSPSKKRGVPAAPVELIAAEPPATRTRSKTPQAASRPADGKVLRVTNSSQQLSRGASRAVTPAPPNSVKHRKPMPAPVENNVAASSIENPSGLAVFDFPSSSDDLPSQPLIRPRPRLSSHAKTASKPAVVPKIPSPEPSAESDESNTSHKRKRRPSLVSIATMGRMNPAEQKGDPSVHARSQKYQKKRNGASPGHVSNDQSEPIPLKEATPEIHINKPKRTRTRTVPVISKPGISKAQSSPVKLHDMLTVRLASRELPAQHNPEINLDEDETMYDIQDATTPIPRTKKPLVPGTVTPRQQTLFSNLLGDSSDSTTPMPSISKLQLTDRRPGSAVATLTRSSSDIPQSAHSRKGRLLDMLKQTVPSSDEESEDDEEAEEGMTEIPAVSVPSKLVAMKEIASQHESDNMEVDSETQTSSQAFQTAMLLHDDARVTYAKQRSYLEESNLEDSLLMSIDFDEELGLSSAKKYDFVSESEEDSQQVLGIHELRRKGQHYKFESDIQAAIEDVSGNSGLNTSGRRSAMIELASQIAEKKYVEQLLESGMTASLLQGISATGDAIFDFAAATAVLFILRIKPGFVVVDQIYQSGVILTLRKLLFSDLSSLDIYRIARDRRANMAPSAREMVKEFRSLVLQTCSWPIGDLVKLSPQFVAMKALEEIVVGLRKGGNTESLVDESVLVKIIDAVSGSSTRIKSGKASPQDHIVLDTAFSILESLSVSNDGHSHWSNGALQRLVEMMSTVFKAITASSRQLVVRLCMNLANNKPKICQVFADERFITCLTRFIIECFGLLNSELNQERKAEVREDLILSLGAMINLAEFSEQARLNVTQEGDGLIDELVKIFLEGSERADRVCWIHMS